MLKRELEYFFGAIRFFTRLPVPAWVGHSAEALNHSARYFPAVGLLVGGIGALVYLGAALLWPKSVAVLLSMAATIYATGAFHEDGFADMCDGFGGGMTRERVLEIMKDSRIGAYGAIGIGCLLALKVTLLALLPPAVAIAALFLAHPVSRLAATALIWRLDYARAEGKAKPMAQEMTSAEFAIGFVCATLPALLLGFYHYLSWGAILGGALGAAGAAFWLARKCVRRIGGYTGDCLGAVQQVAEVAIYLSVLASLGRAAW